MDTNGTIKGELKVFEAMYNFLKIHQPVDKEDIKTLEIQCDKVISLAPQYEYLKRSIKELKILVLTEKEKKLKDMLKIFWERFSVLESKKPLDEEGKKQRDELFNVHVEKIIELDPEQVKLKEIYVELLDFPPGAFA